MYPNLRAEMIRGNITAKMIATTIDVNPSAVSAKMNTKDRFKLCEAMAIRDKHFRGMPIEYLFSEEAITPADQGKPA